MARALLCVRAVEDHVSRGWPRPCIRSAPVMSRILLTTAFLACVACQPTNATKTKDLTPAAGVLVVRAAPAASEEYQDILSISLRRVPAGRYAVFVSAAAPENRAALTTFDVDKECSPAPAKTSTPTPSSAYAEALDFSCTARGIFKGGTDGEVATVTIDAAAAQKLEQVRVARGGKAPVVSLVPLDGGTLAAPLTVSVYAEGGGGCAEPDEPELQAVTLDP
jgi:hypothetical protein